MLALRPWGELPSPRRRLARFACSRGLGWLLGAALTGGATLALAAGALAGFMLGSADLFFRFAILAILPLALGVLFLAGPAGRPSARLRRVSAGIGVAAALALVAAASFGGRRNGVGWRRCASRPAGRGWRRAATIPALSRLLAARSPPSPAASRRYRSAPPPRRR